MINKETARRISNEANRQNWLKGTKNKLNLLIMAAAKTSKREIIVSLETLVFGAESLYECCEILTDIQHALEQANYTTIIQLDGKLKISW